jgi:hypothetical protein
MAVTSFGLSSITSWPQSMRMAVQPGLLPAISNAASNASQG